MLGLIPLFIQLALVFGIIQVVYNPLKYILGISDADILALTTIAQDILKTQELGPSVGLTIVELVHNAQHTAAFAQVVSANTIETIFAFDTYFLGINLALVPTFTSILVLLPILSGLSALLLCIVQNKENVLQQQQGFWGKWGHGNIFNPIFTLFCIYSTGRCWYVLDFWKYSCCPSNLHSERNV